MGSIIGCSTASWQVAIESAQVLAGLVSYPLENSFNYYHLKAWTLANQIPALFLWAGLSERFLSFFLSGLLGAISFTSLSLCTFALCRSVYLSLLSPLIVLSLFLARDPSALSYPIFMLGSYHTYGILGRGTALLVLGLLGVGYRRSAMLLLGCAPAIHPTWGLWTVIVAFTGLLLARSISVKTIKQFMPWFAAGILVSVISLVYQLTVARGLPAVSADVQSQYLDAFFTNWDFHRKPAPLVSPGMALVVASVVLAFIFLRSTETRSDPLRRFMLAAFAVTGLMSIAGCILPWFPGVLPETVYLIMPGRFANLSIYAFPALLLGLMGMHPNQKPFQLLLVTHLVYVIWNWSFIEFLSSDKYGWSLAHWKEFIAITFAIIGLHFYLLKRSDSPESSKPLSRLIVALPALAVLLVALLSVNKVRIFEPLAASKNDIVLQTAFEGEGLLITSGNMEIMQLKTRRPLLVNTGALDQVSYVPASGPEMNRALTAVYGVDLFDPPEAIRIARPGALLKTTGKDLWESRNKEQWVELGETFNATQILTFSDWTLGLPLEAENDRYRLYRIPRQADPEGLETTH